MQYNINKETMQVLKESMDELFDDIDIEDSFLTMI